MEEKVTNYGCYLAAHHCGAPTRGSPPLRDPPTAGSPHCGQQESAHQGAWVPVQRGGWVLAESAPGDAKPHTAACPKEAKWSPAAGEVPRQRGDGIWKGEESRARDTGS